MNKEIITKGLALLKYTYPNTFKDYSKEDTEMMIIVWLDAFIDDDPKSFEIAIKRIMKTSKWCPSIAEIKQEIAVINNPVLQLNVDEEWNTVLQAIRKYGYMQAAQAFETLKPETLEIVKQVGWYKMCMSENIDYERRYFYELFNGMQKRISNATVVSHKELTGTERLMLDGSTM